VKISGLETFEYSLYLKKPLSVGTEVLHSREGILLKCKTPDGRHGWGEAAPLPGFSPDTIADCRAQLPGLIKGITGCESYAMLSTHLDLEALSPSLRFALELVLWNLDIEELMPLELRELKARQSLVYVNALLTAEEESSQSLKELHQRGYRSVKLKVGRGELRADIARVKELLSSVPSDMSIRFDANCAWTLDEALFFAAACKDYNVEYIEEPLKNVKQLPEFIERSSMPVALDESLAIFNVKELEKMTGVKAFVLKPSLQSGFTGCARLAKLAEGIGAYVVITTSFESGLAVAGLARFAASISGKQHAHGLDTLKWFEETILEPELEVKNGRINILSLSSCKVKEKLLQPLS